MSKTMARRAIGSCVVLAAVFIIGSWLQPASAHIGTVSHLWTEHIRPKADARYLENTHVYISAVFTLNPSADLTVHRMCPSGMQALGGGVDFQSGASANVRVTSNAPLVNGDNLVAADQGKNPASNGWRVKIHNNNGAGSYTDVVGVVCSD